MERKTKMRERGGKKGMENYEREGKVSILNFIKGERRRERSEKGF